MHNRSPSHDFFIEDRNLFIEFLRRLSKQKSPWNNREKESKL